MSDTKMIIDLCLMETSKNPVKIMEKLMAQPGVPMHGPVHHVLVGSALLTAYHNAGGEIDLAKALEEMSARGGQVPGGVCGLWGACGAAISTGQFLSIATGSSPLNNQVWGLCNRMTAKALESIGQLDGPRCCKRDSFLAILSAVDFAAEQLGVQMEKTMPVCGRSGINPQCLKEGCPFHGGSEG